jgi:AraC-like DNA-binding protein
VAYREFPPPARLRELVECVWVRDGPAESLRVLPDGCMDLVRMDGRVVVAGPDVTAFVSSANRDALAGLRFRPGALPRLLGVPAFELRNARVPLDELRSASSDWRSLTELAAGLACDPPRTETAPWSLTVLGHVTRSLAAGARVAEVAREIGWSSRTLQRQCLTVYGYGPAMLRRVLRFRRATALLRIGLPVIDVAVRAGYADQPHLHREARELAGVPLRQLLSGANTSTDVPSGSSTVA